MWLSKPISSYSHNKHKWTSICSLSSQSSRGWGAVAPPSRREAHPSPSPTPWCRHESRWGMQGGHWGRWSPSRNPATLPSGSRCHSLHVNEIKEVKCFASISVNMMTNRVFANVIIFVLDSTWTSIAVGSKQCCGKARWQRACDGDGH